MPRPASLRGAATFGVVGLALAAAAATGLSLPHPAYTAGAIVGIEGGPASLRPALIQAAADAARSRRVAARAATSLPGKLATRPEVLAAELQVDAGRVPGTLILRVADGDGERAASLASALAGALVTELEDRAQATRRDGDAAAATRLSHLQEVAAEAHRKLAALGGDAADPAPALGTAASRAATLQARLDAIRSILAAGNPPLGAGRDVPPVIDALQTAYLDLTRQLAKARETLGERHTTVVGLQESTRRSAAELTAAWAHLAKATEQELSDARKASAKAGVDPTGAASLDAARAAVRVADDAVARAAAPRDDDEPRWHLVARASAPALADGLGLPLRLALAAAAGLLVLFLGLRSVRRRHGGAAELSIDDTAPSEPTFFDDNAPLYEAFVEEALSSATELENTVEAPALTSPTPRIEPALAPSEPIRAEAQDERADETPTMNETVSRDELAVAMAPVLPLIAALAPRADVPVVLVATDEAGLATTVTALAVGAAAAAEGRRVLVVETHARPALAAFVAPDAAPALIDVLGETRIVLRAESGDGQIYLAPAFPDGARLAADLARAGTALAADALADEFDLVVVDGGPAMDATAVAEAADAVLRVGRFASPGDGARLMTSLGAPGAVFLGTFATIVSDFVRAPPRPTPARQTASIPRVPFGPHPLRRTAPADVRRRVGAR